VPKKANEPCYLHCLEGSNSFGGPSPLGARGDVGVPAFFNLHCCAFGSRWLRADAREGLSCGSSVDANSCIYA